MRSRTEGSVACQVRTPRLLWNVAAYDAQGVQLAVRVVSSLSAAYRVRDSLLRWGASVVVVEVL